MEIAYLDTSALVKRYHQEEYSDSVDEILESYIAVISELTLVEFTSALRRKANEGSIGNADVFRVLAKFHDDLDNFVILRFDTGIISKAMEFVLEYSIKTLDSLQLAFAVKLKDYDPLFVSFDQKLLQCAKSEGLRVIKFD